MIGVALHCWITSWCFGASTGTATTAAAAAAAAAAATPTPSASTTTLPSYYICKRLLELPVPFLLGRLRDIWCARCIAGWKGSPDSSPHFILSFLGNFCPWLACAPYLKFWTLKKPYRAPCVARCGWADNCGVPEQVPPGVAEQEAILLGS